MNNAIVEAARLQTAYKRLFKAKKVTKQAICDLCVPFRDKYGLTDLQTLQVARNELTLAELVRLFRLDKEAF